MKSKNDVILKYGLIIVIIIFIANAVYYMNMTLDEPVFLKHYYEVDLYDREHLSIHFIDNSNVKNQLYDIDFPQLPEDFAYISISDFYNKKDGFDRSIKHAHYNYNTIFLEIRNTDRNQENKNEETIILDKAIIKYYGGHKQEVDIGKIVIHKNTKEQNYTDNFYSSISNNFSFGTKITAIKDIAIENIESYMDEEINGFMGIVMNDVKIENLKFPVIINNGDSIFFKKDYNFTSEDNRKYNVYNVQKRIMFSDMKGNKRNGLIHNLNYDPKEIFLTERGIIDYLKFIGVK